MKKMKFVTPLNEGSLLLAELRVKFIWDQETQAVALDQILYQQAYSTNQVDLTRFLQLYCQDLWTSLEAMAYNHVNNLYPNYIKE